MKLSARARVALSLFLVTLVLLQGQACGQLVPKASSDLPSSGVSGSDSNAGGGPGGGAVALPEDQLVAIETVRVVHKQEYLAGVHSILDLPYSTPVYTSYTSLGANLSEDGAVDSVTAPMMNSLLSLNGTACNEQIRLEKAQAAAARKIFKGFDFTKSPVAQTATASADLIRTLARRAWLRDETPAERTAILEAAKLFDTSVVADTERKALFICSALLTSLDAVTR